MELARASVQYQRHGQTNLSGCSGNCHWVQIPYRSKRQAITDRLRHLSGFERTERSQLPAFTDRSKNDRLRRADARAPRSHRLAALPREGRVWRFDLRKFFDNRVDL